MPTSISQTDIAETIGQQVAITDQISVRVLTIGSVILGKNWCYPDLCAPHWRLYLNHDEGAAIGLADERWPIPAGVPVVVPPWLHWRAIPGAGVRHDFLQFLVPGVSDAVIRSCMPRPLALPGADLAGLLQQACSGLGATLAVDSVLLAKAAATVALTRIVQTLAPTAAALFSEQLTRPHPVRALAAAMVADPAADWSVEAIAGHLGCSSDHATRLFRRILGDTPARVVTERRLTAAAELLTHSHDSIEAIAEACGFADRFSFSRAFARRFGSGPASWRRMGGNAAPSVP